MEYPKLDRKQNILHLETTNFYSQLNHLSRIMLEEDAGDRSRMASDTKSLLFLPLAFCFSYLCLSLRTATQVIAGFPALSHGCLGTVRRRHFPRG